MTRLALFLALLSLASCAAGGGVTVSCLPGGGVGAVTSRFWSFNSDSNVSAASADGASFSAGTMPNEGVTSLAGRLADALAAVAGGGVVPGARQAPADRLGGLCGAPVAASPPAEPAVRRSAAEPVWRAVPTRNGVMMAWVAGEP